MDGIAVGGVCCRDKFEIRIKQKGNRFLLVLLAILKFCIKVKWPQVYI